MPFLASLRFVKMFCGLSLDQVLAYFSLHFLLLSSTSAPATFFYRCAGMYTSQHTAIGQEMCEISIQRRCIRKHAAPHLARVVNKKKNISGVNFIPGLKQRAMVDINEKDKFNLILIIFRTCGGRNPGTVRNMNFLGFFKRQIFEKSSGVIIHTPMKQLMQTKKKLGAMPKG